MENLKITKVYATEAQVDNSLDAGRAYDISARVNIDANGPAGISGEVRTTDTRTSVASFNIYGAGNKNITFNGGVDTDEPAVLAAVNRFIAQCSGLNLKNASL